MPTRVLLPAWQTAANSVPTWAFLPNRDGSTIQMHYHVNMHGRQLSSSSTLGNVSLSAARRVDDRGVYYFAIFVSVKQVDAVPTLKPTSFPSSIG
jgi:hypothetical protein